MEFFIKFTITIVFVVVFYYQTQFLKTMWSSQIDPIKTFQIFFRKLEPSPVFVTRDPMKIYQSGNIVGSIGVEPTMQENILIFPELYETANFNSELFFEYKRYKLKVSKIERKIGTLVNMNGSKNRVLRGVYCSIIKDDHG
ncbi:MAG: hypothetical protein NUV91_01845 [Candidatus Omnitrophica bacterium]|nr:hypothetical protein [Candidatus Omnitrophota bacterium]